MPSESRDRRISDPLTDALQPPPDETAAERTARLEAERAAKKISDDIDEEIRLEKEARKQKLKRRKEIKILLLGQSESGKSTTLKQFQLAYTPNAFREELLAWRPVIYLNLVRSVRRILDSLSSNDNNVTGFHDEPSTNAGGKRDSSSTNPQDSSTAQSPSLVGPSRYDELRARFAPLLALEDGLIKQLSADEDDEATQLAWPPRISNPTLSPTSSGPVAKTTEVAVHNRRNWKKALNKLASGTTKGTKSDADGWWNDPTDPGHILNQFGSDIEQLWGDATIRAELNKKRIRVEEGSGFYLDSVARITALRYIPSDDDVLRARLKTVGVVEHIFELEVGRERGVDWKIYDVGGERSQRQAWAPYFEDMNAIIFLAPISAFDQVLTEDHSVNRVEDTLLLWRSVVANKLLSNVNIILFLNKCDLLKTKLEAGVRLNQFMISYGDRPNDQASVTKYFSNKFLALHQSYSPNKDREIYLHLTAVTDTRRTSSIITNVRDIILRDGLKDVKLL